MRAYLGFDDDWVRPLPSDWFKRDAGIALLVFFGSILGLEAMRALSRWPTSWPRPALYLAVFLGALPLVWRRRYPVSVMAILALHMFVLGLSQAIVMTNTAMQAAYFFAIFTAMAWGRDRRTTVLATTGIVIFMFGWVAVQLAVGSMADRLGVGLAPGHSSPGALFGPMVGAVVYTFIVNVLFFFTAVGSGANSWRGARARARAVEQAETIQRQADQLAEQAVVEERLRIARELHDVVAHHVAAIGIQAAAARKVMTKDPEQATESLTQVEASSRDAVQQMRALLGTLRESDPGRVTVPKITTGQGIGSHARLPEPRSPEPQLHEIPDLVRQVEAQGLAVRYTDLLSEPQEVPAAAGHSVYRTIQESLANVRRHSTATSASVTVRNGTDDAGRRYVEAEILDDGRPRQGTSGSGLGLLGMRERVLAHRGSVEIGPRVMGGYRVRVRLPYAPASRPQEETR